jgi:hypothetical protein
LVLVPPRGAGVGGRFGVDLDQVTGGTPFASGVRELADFLL